MIWGLTGGIGTGKSTAARVFRRLGIPVFDADVAVHALQGPGGAAVRPIGAAFPGTVCEGRVDRTALRAAVLADPASLARLEAIVHPLVRASETRFVARGRRQRRRAVLLDIPLLMETRKISDFDRIIVTSAPAGLQALRVLRRPGMTPERLAAIRRRQMPDAQRRRHADLWLRNGVSRNRLVARIRRWVRNELDR